jgi:hypothetical protein
MRASTDRTVNSCSHDLHHNETTNWSNFWEQLQDQCSTHRQQGNDNNNNKMPSTMNRMEIQAKKRQTFKIKIIYNLLVRKVANVLF